MGYHLQICISVGNLPYQQGARLMCRGPDGLFGIIPDLVAIVHSNLVLSRKCLLLLNGVFCCFSGACDISAQALDRLAAEKRKAQSC